MEKRILYRYSKRPYIHTAHLLTKKIRAGG